MITLKEAEEYLDFGIKEGNYDEGEFDGWTDEENIEFAGLILREIFCSVTFWSAPEL